MVKFYDFCMVCGYSDTSRHIKFTIFHKSDDSYGKEMFAHFHNIIDFAEYNVICITSSDGGILELIIQEPEE